MGQPADTFSAYDAIGNREDLENVIYDISPTETPFMAMIGRTNAKAKLHEWQMDGLAAASTTNRVIEGDDATTDATSPTQRLRNECQISDKVPRVSGTQEAVDKAGRKSEMAYQLMKKAKELKRDMESMLCQDGQKIPGDDSTARSTAGFETWIYDGQSSRGATGTDTAGLSATVNQPNDTAGPAPGTQRAFSEDLLKTVLSAVWSAGGDPSKIILGPINKARASTFAGNATRMDRSEDKKLTAAVDVYISDFGEHMFVPSRFSRERSGLVVDPSLWAVGYLRSFRQWDLAKTGDTDRKQLLVEYCLVAKNPTGSGIIADLTTT
jgi:hypothetical protein